VSGAGVPAARGTDATTWKVVEVAPVGEDSLEQALNRLTAAGWAFQSMHFVMREGSHRPAMAYLFFARGG
jgi:hypothetical protein